MRHDCADRAAASALGMRFDRDGLAVARLGLGHVLVHDVFLDRGLFGLDDLFLMFHADVIPAEPIRACSLTRRKGPPPAGAQRFPRSGPKAAAVEPLDLTAAPPRSPRESLGGLVMLARTIDKLRAELPGGNRGEYQSVRGLTILQLELLGIARDELLDVVVRAGSDDDVVRWVHAHSDAARYPAINERLSRYTLADNPPERWDFVDQLYPNRPKLPREQVNVFDLLDQDDREAFPASP